MVAYINGRLEAERPHSPRECSEIECCDCYEHCDADEDYCHICSEPLCADCAQIVADEPLCAKCYERSRQAAVISLQSDPGVGDLFPKAA